MTADTTHTPAAAAPHAAIPIRLTMLLLVVLAFVAAISVVALGSVTAPDANAWLSWAHQVTGGHSIDFQFGPSWKPLPFITMLGLSLPSTSFASAGWLFITRFAWLSVSLLIFLIVSARASRLCAIIAALLPLAIPAWVNIGLVGDAEAVVVALSLTAVLCHFKGHWLSVIALLTLACLARPELWPFLAAYEIWQIRVNGAKAFGAAVASSALIAAGWFGLPWFIAAGHHTQVGMPSGHSLKNASLKTIWNNFLSVQPPKAWVLTVVGVIGIFTRRDRLALLFTAIAALLLAEITILWALPIDVSASGYTPVVRYFAPVGVLLCVVAGCGVQTLIEATPIGRWRQVVELAAVGLLALALWGSAPEVKRQVDRYRTVERASKEAVLAIRAAGGTALVKPCLPFTVSSFSAIGWSISRRLDLPLSATTTKARTPSVALNYTAGSWALGTPPPQDTQGSRVIGRSPSWQVIYYPGKSGCLS